MDRWGYSPTDGEENPVMVLRWKWKNQLLHQCAKDCFLSVALVMDVFASSQVSILSY